MYIDFLIFENSVDWNVKSKTCSSLNKKLYEFMKLWGTFSRNHVKLIGSMYKNPTFHMLKTTLSLMAFYGKLNIS